MTITRSSHEDRAPEQQITVELNGQIITAQIEDRQLLVDFVRDGQHLTGTHVGCYNGDCGACTMRVDGKIVKSCLVLAASVDGSSITTIEGYSPNGKLDHLQQALWDNDAFQCGFCVPGHLFVLSDLLEENPDPTDEEIRTALIGNLCRCTGYLNLVRAAKDAAKRMHVS
jgi:aerobic-type carbon monoxide dehydrogenase small subunit (CoxS/CutS family)